MERKGIIYCAYNKTNGKRYIGQTVQPLERRKKKHYQSDSAPFFHSALLKYSEECWEWKIVDAGIEGEELDSKEIFWIDFFNTTNPQKGYNILLGGQKDIVSSHTKENIKYARDRLIEVNDIERRKRKEIFSVKCVETGEIFCDCREAANFYGIKTNSHITEVLKGKHKTAGGYHWVYSEDISCFKRAFICVEKNKIYVSFLQAQKEDGFSAFYLAQKINENSPCVYGGYTFKWLNR